MYLVINKCVTAVKVSNSSGHYLRNRSTLDTGVLGYIGIVQHKEHSPEVLSIPPGTSCIYRHKQQRKNNGSISGVVYRLRTDKDRVESWSRGLSDGRIQQHQLPRSTSFLR